MNRTHKISKDYELQHNFVFIFLIETAFSVKKKIKVRKQALQTTVTYFLPCNFLHSLIFLSCELMLKRLFEKLGMQQNNLFVFLNILKSSEVVCLEI